jgi:hypothetical protein
MKYRYSKQKSCITFKSIAAFVLVSSVILTLVFTVIYVVVTALAGMSDEERKQFINILIGIAAGLLLMTVLIAFRNCKKNFFEHYMFDWKIFNVDGSKIYFYY